MQNTTYMVTGSTKESNGHFNDATIVAKNLLTFDLAEKVLLTAVQTGQWGNLEIVANTVPVNSRKL